MRELGQEHRLVHLPLDGLQHVVGEATHLDAMRESDVAVVPFAKDLEGLIEIY